jgi:UDP-glucuronate 4-epimerase
MRRDFTHVNDIIEGVVRISNVLPGNDSKWTVEQGTPASSSAPYAVYNIGHGSPISLMDFVKAIEDELGVEAKKNFREMQLGDVYQTYADTQDLFAATGYKPKIGIREGVSEFITWYKGFYNK